MPTAYQFTPLALEDLDAIYSYIAKNSVSAAIRVEQAILQACQLLAKNPKLGSTRKDLTPFALRFWTVSKYSNYLVVYWPETKPLQIVAIWHGDQLFSGLDRRF
jgi:plasmid stabilization system protein ParE